MLTLRLSLLSMAMLMGGCSLIPEYQRPASPTAAQYPNSHAASHEQRGLAHAVH